LVLSQISACRLDAIVIITRTVNAWRPAEQQLLVQR